MVARAAGRAAEEVKDQAVVAAARVPAAAVAPGAGAVGVEAPAAAAVLVAAVVAPGVVEAAEVPVGAADPGAAAGVVVEPREVPAGGVAAVKVAAGVRVRVGARVVGAEDRAAGTAGALVVVVIDNTRAAGGRLVRPPAPRFPGRPKLPIPCLQPIPTWRRS